MAEFEDWEPKFGIVKYKNQKTMIIVDTDRIYEKDVNGYLRLLKSWEFDKTSWYFISFQCSNEDCAKRKKKSVHLHYSQAQLVSLTDSYETAQERLTQRLKVPPRKNMSTASSYSSSESSENKQCPT